MRRLDQCQINTLHDVFGTVPGPVTYSRELLVACWHCRSQVSPGAAALFAIEGRGEEEEGIAWFRRRKKKFQTRRPWTQDIIGAHVHRKNLAVDSCAGFNLVLSTYDACFEVLVGRVTG
ncbi:hypothetical protein RRG08_059258 [Elysia crispata]|uniref:Uncharacterized protein n=1 Tax=Elysia crispata TaxID=231223 RepID=A0AAE1CUW5_9GAST|nr:hypothetical protein RRG08_059258 [Elysia crispata]